MPLIYADTSTLVAFFHPRDIFAIMVTEAVRQESPDFIYWPFLRFELRHNLRAVRTDSFGDVAWRALRTAEKTATRLRWQAELTADKMLEAAEELSGERAGDHPCGGAGFLHVAAARRMNSISELDEFWTCDAAQAELARAVGLKMRLFDQAEEKTAKG